MEEVSLKSMKRAQRRFNNLKHVRKQLTLLKHYDMLNSSVIAGKFVKRKALNCGNPRCCLCTSDSRAYGHVSLKEEVNILAFKEALKDLNI